jgi:cyclic-di-GMP-binding protein
MEKFAKRGVPLEGLDPQKLEPASGGHVRQLVKLRRGLKSEDAKKIVALVKERGLKVQAAIQGEAVRITGKKKDDLQECMQVIRGGNLGIPLQFQNFRE